MSAGVGKRAPFELLAFAATPVAGALVVVELEGRFASTARFTRPPMLVVEPGEDRPRLELAPVRSALTDGRWRGAYAIPAEALPDARFALGVRGTLLELPAPDEPDDAQRLTALAREANTLRRALEAAEAEADATTAELGAAVLAARDEALAESTDRVRGLEAELAGAHRTAAAAREEAEARAEEAEATHAAALAAAQERHAAALAAAERAHASALDEIRVRADDAEARALAAEAGAEAARAADAEGGDDETAAARADEAEARAGAAEDAARVTTSGIEVLRAELAEERERSAAVIAELEAELTAARRRADALRNAAAAEQGDGNGDDATRVLPPGDAGEDATVELSLRDGGEDATAALPSRGDDEDDPPRALAADATTPLAGRRRSVPPPGEPGDARPRRSSLRRMPTIEPIAPTSTHRTGPRGAGPWIAVGALVLFAFVLLGLLLGFLG